MVILASEPDAMLNVLLCNNTQKVNKQKFIANKQNSYWFFKWAERDIFNQSDGLAKD